MSDQTPRERYAASVCKEAGVTSERIVRGFATVPREKFVGPGPWKVLPANMQGDYDTTPDDDPTHLYHNVLVALDPERRLNNGLPSWLAGAMQKIDPKEGERVVHIGAGVGYYTAILAEIVGPRGSVLGIEVDQELAARAKENLSGYPNVEIRCENGSEAELEEADAIFVNAGATHLQQSWIQNLAQGGRLLVPLTFARDKPGQLLRVNRTNGTYAAEFVQEVYIFPCVGSREDDYAKALREAFESRGMSFSGKLRFDPESADSNCYLKTDWYWLASE